MSLLLGIYSKRGEVDTELVKPVIDDFRVNRDIQVISTGKFILAGCKKWLASMNVFESANKDFITGISGEILDFGNEAKELQNKGFEFQNSENGSEFILHAYNSTGDKFLMI